MIGGKECDIKLAHPQRNQNGPGGHMGGGGFGGPRGGAGRGPQGTFFKNSNRNPNSVGNNWRSGERPAGGFRGGPSGGHGDDRGFPETQFLTNVDTMPNNGYGGYKNYNNSNFFPNYWN